MMFDKAILFTLKNEGVYSNDPDDKGGETKWGISKKAHPDVDIVNLTSTEALLIYRKHYWNPLYEKLPTRLGVRLFDVGVNIGVKKAVSIFQRALNEEFGSTLVVDGVFGRKSLHEALIPPQDSLYSIFVFKVSLYYSTLQKKYFKGWLNRLYKEI